MPFKLSLLVAMLFFLMSTHAQDNSKSFDESFNEVKEQASNPNKQSADKINSPKKIDNSPDDKGDSAGSGKTVLWVALLVVGGVVVGRMTSKKKSS